MGWPVGTGLHRPVLRINGSELRAMVVGGFVVGLIAAFFRLIFGCNNADGETGESRTGASQ